MTLRRMFSKIQYIQDDNTIYMPWYKKKKKYIVLQKHERITQEVNLKKYMLW